MSLKSFQKLEKIGEGTYGVVYKAEDKAAGRLVALKKIRIEAEEEGIPATTLREIIILNNLKHPNIIDLLDVVYSGEKMYLVFEYVETDLKKLMLECLGGKQKLEPHTVKKIAKQLCSAVAHCHSCSVFHRDLKPQNVLINSNYDAKLADFGLSRLAGIPLRVYTTEIVTLWYRAPELLLGSKYYDASLDVWSLACILVELITFTPLFMGDSEIDQLHKIFRVLGLPKNSDWDGVENLPSYNLAFPNYEPTGLASLIKDPKLESLISQMLVFDPLKRITASKALNHEYFTDD